MKKKTNEAPLFMVAQLPFNRTETVKLNTPMIPIMNDQGNVNVSLTNLKSLGVFSEIIQPKTHFLEIGCGSGYLIEKLNELGKGTYYGLEPIKSEYLKSVKRLGNSPGFNKNNLKQRLKNKILEKVDFKAGQFDFIYSYHVFEHIENPLVMIEFAKKWLKKNGKLIITCPNVEGWFPKHNLEKWRCSISSHRWLPGKSTLERAIKKNGLMIEKVFTYGGFPAPRSIWQNISNQIFKWLDLGDVICIMGKK